MSAYMVFDSDGYCIEKHASTDSIIIQNTPVAVDSLVAYPGMDWIYNGSVISAMTTEQSRLRRRKLKSARLQDAEVSYGDFLALLGLAIDADSSTISTKLFTMKALSQTLPYLGQELSPSEIQGMLYALMHDIEVNGGSWETL